jgi:hypothetical protein
MKRITSLPTVASMAIVAVALLGLAPHGRMMAGSPGGLVPSTAAWADCYRAP